MITTLKAKPESDIYDKKLLSFLKENSNLSTKKEIVSHLLNILSPMFNTSFSSFVEWKSDDLDVITQFGDGSLINTIFSNQTSKDIYNWVLNQNQIALLKISKGQFIFIPIIDKHGNKNIEHGMFVLHLANPDFKFTKRFNYTVNILARISALSLTRILNEQIDEKKSDVKNKTNDQLQSLRQVQELLSENNLKKNNYRLIADNNLSLSGNLWNLSDVSIDKLFIFTAEINPKNILPPLLVGYLMGEISSLLNRREICFYPKEILKYLNNKLNVLYKGIAISVKAFCGVVDFKTKNMIYSSADYPSPFLIGPEQQVTQLITKENNMSLGINTNTIFKESNIFVTTGSRLVICNESFLDEAARVGEKYDHNWLSQVLETLGGLSLDEMYSSLNSLLLKTSTGTANNTSRLALLIEVSS